MSQYLSELCTLLIEDAYGAFFSHIFSTLLASGRLGVTQLAQKCHLPPRQIRYGLSGLIQAQLVFYHLSADKKTYYEANTGAAYNLARAGKIIHAVEDELGSDAALIITDLLLVGHARIEFLRHKWQSEDFHVEEIHSNSQNERTGELGKALEGPMIYDDKRSERRFHQVFGRLVTNGYVLRVRKAHFHNMQDNYLDAKGYILAHQMKPEAKGKKAQDELEERVQQELLASNDSKFPGFHQNVGSSGRLKRPAADGQDTTSKKRIKLANGSLQDLWQTDISADALVNDRLDENMEVAVNYEKVVALLRYQRLVDTSKRKLGYRTSQIYEAVLQQFRDGKEVTRLSAQRDLEGCDPDYQEINFDSVLMAANMNDFGLDGSRSRSKARLNGSFKDSIGDEPLQSAKHHANGYVNGDGDHENRKPVTSEEIKSHFGILAKQPWQFIVQGPKSQYWAVDLSHLSSQLRMDEILRLVKSRFSTIALRIIRILLDKGKLDEKCLQEIALLSARDLRQCLARLKAAGFVELQEVPREPQRQPSRTIYLWYFDEERVRGTLLADLYKAMARLFQRLKVERERVGVLSEKVERSDVRGNEEKWLSPQEMVALKAWRSKEEWLLGEIQRLDDSVTVLRDF